MLNIIFSIPIHQRFEVVLDQIYNFRHFNPNCGIVFHLSQGFDEAGSALSKDEFLSIVEKIGNVYINPTSVRTGFADIIQAHISNFEYVKDCVDFDFFAVCASNEAFVRSGLYDYIRDFDCGFSSCPIKKASDWRFGDWLFQDEKLLSYVNNTEAKILNFTKPEGQYYKKNLFLDICTKIKGFYDYNVMPFAYPREEVYFSTIACNMNAAQQSLKIGDIFTYSAYHFAFLWDVSRIECNRVSSGRYPFFSVKRVDRSINDNIRIYLREKFGYVGKLRSVLPSRIKLKKLNVVQIDFMSLKKNVKQLCNNWKKIPKFFSNKWKT